MGLFSAENRGRMWMTLFWVVIALLTLVYFLQD